ncbi:MAG: ribbon-helix-helix domain-containing protein [Rivularia sp. (in: cyanobacteria)]
MRKSIHGQRKRNVNFTMTPDAIEMLDAKAETLGVSKSELIERIARDQISSETEVQLLGKSFAS